VGRLEGSSDWDVDVRRLLWRQLGEPGTQLGEMQGSHLLI